MHKDEISVILLRGNLQANPIWIFFRFPGATWLHRITRRAWRKSTEAGASVSADRDPLKLRQQGACGRFLSTANWMGKLGEFSHLEKGWGWGSRSRGCSIYMPQSGHIHSSVCFRALGPAETLRGRAAGAVATAQLHLHVLRTGRLIRFCLGKRVFTDF